MSDTSSFSIFGVVEPINSLRSERNWSILTLFEFKRSKESEFSRRDKK